MFDSMEIKAFLEQAEEKLNKFVEVNALLEGKEE